MWRARGGVRRLALVAGLTVLAVLIHGYHPYAEDGGVYAPGVQRLLEPGLFGSAPKFVLAPTRVSLFAPLVAGLVRGLHVPLAYVLLLLYGAGIGLTLAAAMRIVECLGRSEAGRAGAVTLLACWLALPVAGTSLLLFDPYVTARTLCLPLVLFGVGYAARGRWLAAGLLAGCAAGVHPLMAGYGFAAICCVGVFSVRNQKARWLAAVCGGAAGFTAAALVQWRGAPESAGYRAVVLTRYYWFPLQWHWYEQLGALLPLLLVLWLRRGGEDAGRRVAKATALLGAVALAVALAFAHAGLATHAVARLQPMRAFQLVYVVMILLLGYRVGERWVRQSWPRRVVLVVCAGGPLLFAALQTYPASRHVELPWLEPRNRWQQAFAWVRGNTPREARFALDARYITEGKGEDAQCFRPLAERDALADYSKDGGEASIAPALTAAWQEGVEAQAGLSRQPDAERLGRLRPLGVSWVVLESWSRTAWSCPYVNEVVKVCALPVEPSPG